MTKHPLREFPLSYIWMGILLMYIITSYFAQDILMASSVNSLFLYAFLAFSIVFIVLVNKNFRITSIIIWELICMALAFVAMLYSPAFSIFDGTYYAMIVNFVLVIFLAQMDWTITRLNVVFGTFALSAAGLIIVLALTGNLTDSVDRLGTDLVGNANILACMLMVSAIYNIWLLMNAQCPGAKILWGVTLCVIYIGMFLSGGRKFVVVPLIVLYVMMIFKIGESARKQFLKSTLLIAAIVLAVYLLIMKVPFFYESIGYRFEGAFALVNDEFEADGSTAKREQMWQAGFSQWFRSPLWGYGFDSFKFYNAKEVTGNMYYSHNNFVELLYNQGLIGFFAYYSLYAYLFVSAWKLRENSTFKGFVLGVIIGFLFFDFFAVSYAMTPIHFLLLFCCCMLKIIQNDFDDMNCLMGSDVDEKI